MPTDERQRRLDLEREVDELKAEVIVIWGRVRRLGNELATLQGEAEDRQSQSAIDRYRDELPSETQFSLRPTGLRVLLKNARPSAFILFVIVVGIVVLAWVLRLK